jgi:general stress protein 26
VSRDQAKIDELWNPWAAAYFENGREDPSVALLKIEVDTIEYWDLDKPAVVQAFEVLKGIVTKKAPDVGDSGTVQL